MLGEKFTLDIRPSFVDEPDKDVAFKRHNPTTADKLVEDVYATIDETLEHPTMQRIHA